MRFLRAGLCFMAGAGCFWLGSHLSGGEVCPDGRYELRANFSLGSGQMPLLVDSRTGDTWLFFPFGDGPESGWQHFDPPKRPSR